METAATCTTTARTQNDASSSYGSIITTTPSSSEQQQQQQHPTTDATDSGNKKASSKASTTNTTTTSSNSSKPISQRGAIHRRGWSLHEASSLLPSITTTDDSTPGQQRRLGGAAAVSKLFRRRRVAGDDDDDDDGHSSDKANNNTNDTSASKGGWVYYIIYAIVNIIISVPGLYGYAAVIFNHPVFAPHMNALSKLVLFSSLMHQLGFTLFSGLDFAIGTVQDAGLIFLSAMSNQIANTILNRNGGTEEQVLSTTLVLLSGGTACLGLVLIVMGRFRLADAVSYLPMPVVAGYLAFIGYFCLQAGVALCISKPMTTILDWKYLFDAELALLAFPGLLTGLLLTFISRKATNDAALPAAMVAVPVLFYVVIYATGVGLKGAREGKWVGEEAPSVPVSDLFHLVNFAEVQWYLVGEILFIWVGMVFVVSFASCLDVAAISMDMGEALDTNKELATVGICNFMSGLTLGFTGSYIFSQTIFTYRTGVHSRWIGILIMFIFMYVVTSPVNILEVAPLFFLGSTLMFIGYDLIYEWLIEIRHKIFLSEYIIVWSTFVAIQIVGMDAGIIIGVLVSLVDHVVVSATATGVNRVYKQSRAVWRPEESRMLQDQGYHPSSPKIVTLEVVGTVFFGSSLSLLQQLTEEVGIDLQQEDSEPRTDDDNRASLMRSPHTPSHILMKERRNSNLPTKARKQTVMRRPPKFVVLDLAHLTNLDASASRGCFLQFTKLCAKQDIVVCATTSSTRVDWMLRSHEAAYTHTEEESMKALFQAKLGKSPDVRHTFPPAPPKLERILIFLTTYEALEFCEKALLQQMHVPNTGPLGGVSAFLRTQESYSLASVFHALLRGSEEEFEVLARLNGKRYHEEISYSAGDQVFNTNTHADAFYVVLKGAVAVAVDSSRGQRAASFRQKQTVVSGAGPVKKGGSSSNLLHPSLTNEEMVVASMWPVGGIFGYVDFLLQRPRVFRAVATQMGTICAKITHSELNLLQNEDPALDALVQRVLLRVSILDLANCTCDE